MKHGVFNLANGTTIVLEHRPDSVVLAFGLAYSVGPRDESPEEHGFSHGYEHIVSRGSTKYPTTDALVRPLYRLGAETNAYTDWESTAYHTYVPASAWQTAVDLTVDMVQNALFRPADLKLEKGAILEELSGYEDDAEEKVGYALQLLLHGDSSLGRNIVGSKQTIKSIAPDGLRSFRDRHYVPEKTTVVAVGQIPEGLYEDLEERFGDRPRLTPEHRFDALAPVTKRHVAVHREGMEQVRFGLGFPTPFGHGDPRRFAARILTMALTDEACSVLCQEVRDKRGLVYDIETDVNHYRGLGNFRLFAGTAPEKLERAIRTIVREMRSIKKRGLLPQDLADAVSGLTNAMLMASTDDSAELDRLLPLYALDRSIIDRPSRQAAYMAVTNDDIIAVANEMWRASEACLVTVGPVADLAPYLPLLAALGD